MHILIIPSEEYIPKHAPTAGIFQHDQAKILQQHGHQVGVLSFSFKYSFTNLLNVLIGKKIKFTQHLSFFNALQQLLIKIIFPYKSSLTTEVIDDIRMLRCDGFIGTERKLTPAVLYNLWTTYGMFALQEYIKQYGKPDIIHAHNMIYAGLLASYLKNKYDIPIVITEHSSQYAMENIPHFLRKKLNEAFYQIDAMYAVSPRLIELLTTKFSETNKQIQWLPNVLDPIFENKPITLTTTTKPTTFKVLNIGNLIPLKGQQELIKSFATVFKDTDATLTIAGEGYLKDQLQHLINSLEVKDKVSLIGLIPREEVITQLDNCDVFVLPSHYETFGVVLIEALSRGIPVISTYCGGPECIVNDKNGILVSPENENELANALLKMYNTHTQYDKIALRNECLSLYGKDNFYNKIIEIYKTAIKTT